MIGKWTSQLLRAIVDYRLDDRHPQLATLRARLELGLVSEAMARAYLPTVQQAVNEQIERPNLLPSLPDANQLAPHGSWDVELGSLTEDPGQPIGLNILSLPQHSAVIGAPGYGKTVTIKTTVKAAFQKAIALGCSLVVLVFDRKGGDYNDLILLDSARWRHFSVHDGLRLGFNAPQGLPARVWAAVIGTVIAARTGLRYGATTLARMIEWLVGVLNPGASDPQLWPDVRLILDVAHASPPTLFASKAAYDQSMIQALEGLLQPSGELLRTQNGLDVERDLIKPGLCAVFEMSNLQPALLSYVFIDLVLAQILYGRKQRQQKSPKATQILVVLDECDQDVSAASDQAYPGGISMLSQWIMESREFGCATLLGPKSLGHVSRFIRGGLHNFIVLRQTDPPSIAVAAESLLLPRGADVMLPVLRPGEAIVRMAEGWPHPMLAQIDFSAPCTTPKLGGYDTLPSAPSRGLHELPHVQQALQALIDQAKSFRKTTCTDDRKVLSDHARDLLDLASLHLGTPVARLWEKLDVTLASGTRLAAEGELSALKYAVLKTCRIGKVKYKLIEVLPNGFALLGKLPCVLPGRGGLVHRSIAHWIVLVGRKRGIRAQVELIVPETRHPVDAAWIHDDGRLDVFEVIADCTANIPSHLRACLLQATAVHTVTVVVTEAGERARHFAALRAEDDLAPVLDRVRFETAASFMKELWP